MIIDYTADNISDIFEAVKNCSELWSPHPSEAEELWFRGESKDYRLVPGLYRPDNLKLGYGEENLQERFRAYGTPYVEGGRGGTEWDWYFRAQHYGVPTRLLDWTENLMVAIYFSLEGLIDQKDRRRFDEARMRKLQAPAHDDESPVVWVMDAGTLNQFSCGKESDNVFSLVDGPHHTYSVAALESRKRAKNRYPIAILPPKSNPRIVAQQGMFTIHGKDTASIDELAQRKGSCIRLARIRLDRSNVFHHWRDLERFGVFRTGVFPDLESVAQFVRWFGQYPQASPSKRSSPAALSRLQRRTPSISRKGAGASKIITGKRSRLR